MTHVEDLLPAHLLGETDASLRATVDEHLATCPRCRSHALALSETFAHLATAADEGHAEGPRARLFASVDSLERFTPHAAAVAGLLDLTHRQARRALHTLSDADGWRQGPFPRMKWRAVVPGPRFSGATAVLARLQPGAEVRAHRHRGRETMLVLEGSLIDSRGRVVGAGDSLASSADSEHVVRAGDECDCSCVVLDEGGVEWLP